MTHDGAETDLDLGHDERVQSPALGCRHESFRQWAFTKAFPPHVAERHRWAGRVCAAHPWMAEIWLNACAATLKDMGAVIVRGPLEGTWAPGYLDKAFVAVFRGAGFDANRSAATNAIEEFVSVETTAILICDRSLP